MEIDMGALGFFLFLSVVVVAMTWRSVKLAKLRHDTLVRLLVSGQPVDTQFLTLLEMQPVKTIAWAKFKISVLLILGVGAIVLSMIYWQEGAWPDMVAGLVALLVAYATWSHSRKAAQLQINSSLKQVGRAE
jgi:hypothetical protein